MTSLKQTSLFTEEQLTYLQEGSLANLTQQQDLEKGRPMKDISFLRCCELLKKFNQGGSWAKTFVDLLVGGGGLVFDEVCADLEGQGYEVQPVIIPAASVNAPHRRERIWFIAYANDKRTSTRPKQIQSKNGEISEWNNNAKSGNTDFKPHAQTPHSERQESTLENGEMERGRFRKPNERNFWNSFPSQSPICTGSNGIPPELDGITFSKWRQESTKAAGNAIVPQVAYQIFKTINEFEHGKK